MANKKKNSVYVGDIISEDNSPTKVDLAEPTTGIKIDDSVLIRVKSNVFGELIYINQKNGDMTVWSRAGDIQVMTMGDLRAMKSNQSAFFQHQWIIILGVDSGETVKIKPADIYKALAITGYYKHIVEPSDFEMVCSWTVDEIRSNVNLMSDGGKANLIIALNEYINRGLLESITKIRAFERELGCLLALPE